MKKIGLLSLALVLALGTLGIGYATWSDNVTVEEQVFSGEMCAEWKTGCSPNDPGADWNMPEDGDLCLGLDPIPAPEGKDIASANCTREDSDGDGYYDTLVVVVNNAYPSYYVVVDADIKNCGTIPWMIHHVDLLAENGTVLDTFYHIGCDEYDLDGDGLSDIELSYGNNFGVQIDPPFAADISWAIHVLQTAPKGEELVFKLRVYMVQWNMYVAP